MADGRPFAIAKRYTAGLNEKAAQWKDLEAWRGRAFRPEELRGFDICKLLGQTCLLPVIHVERGGRTDANISALRRAPKGMAVPEAVNALLAWDFDRPDWDAFERFTPRLQETFEATPEWAKLPTSGAPASPERPRQRLIARRRPYPAGRICSRRPMPSRNWTPSHSPWRLRRVATSSTTTFPFKR